MARRVEKAVYTYNNGWPEDPGEVQRFVYDGWTLNTPVSPGETGCTAAQGLRPLWRVKGGTWSW